MGIQELFQLRHLYETLDQLQNDLTMVYTLHAVRYDLQHSTKANETDSSLSRVIKADQIRERIHQVISEIEPLEAEISLIPDFSIQCEIRQRYIIRTKSAQPSRRLLEYLNADD